MRYGNASEEKSRCMLSCRRTCRREWLWIVARHMPRASRIWLLSTCGLLPQATCTFTVTCNQHSDLLPQWFELELVSINTHNVFNPPASEADVGSLPQSYSMKASPDKAWGSSQQCHVEYERHRSAFAYPVTGLVRHCLLQHSFLVL